MAAWDCGLELDRAARFQHLDPRSVANELPEGEGILFNHRPRVVVTGYHHLGPYEPDRSHGILRAHREPVAYRQHCKIDLIAQELHLHRERGVSGEVDPSSAPGSSGASRLLPGELHEKATRAGRETLSTGERQHSSVQCRDHLDLAEGVGHRASDVLRAHLEALLLHEARDLEGRDRGSARALQERQEIAHVVVVSVGDQDVVGVQVVDGESGRGVVGEERVYDELGAAGLDREGCVPDERDLRHDS